MMESDGPSDSSLRLISSTSSAKDIIRALASRGCPDLTSSIDLSACGSFPIAGGGLCDVYKGSLEHGTVVAIKCLRFYEKPGQEGDRDKLLKRAARELYHWSKLKHPNVLPLMGLATFRGHMAMISHWINKGNLISYMRSNPDVNRIELCMDICAGLLYIHENGMVHGDLKAANVMVSNNGTALIADFGSARLRDLTLVFTGTTDVHFSVRWAAPELLDEVNGTRVSKKTDVYAYGMTVLEIITGKVPYEGFSEHQVLMMVALKRRTPTRPVSGVSDEVWELLQHCWTWEHSERLDIASVGERLLSLFINPPARIRASSSFGSIRSRISVLDSARPDVLAPPKSAFGGAGPENLQGVGRQTLTGNQGGKPKPAEVEETISLAAARKRLFRQEHPVAVQGAPVPVASCHRQGQLAKAESLGLEALAAQKRTLGQDHPDTLRTMENLAMTYLKQGQRAKADQLEDEVLGTRMRVLGQDHPDTLQSLATLASRWYDCGRLAAAELLGIRVIAARQRVLGSEHPDTLQSVANQAMTYFKQGRLEEAESLGIRVVPVRKKVLGKYHPSTLQSMANLAAVYYHQGRLEDAESLGTKVVASQKWVLGQHHLDTLQSMANLATIHYGRGQMEDAESLGAEVLVVRQRMLGFNHPDTLQSMTNLAAIYSKQGRLDEAESLATKVLVARIRTLGKHHPETVQAIRNLARTYKALGRYPQYKELKKIARSIQLRSTR